MEEEQDIQSDIVKQKQLRDAQENQEFDRDMGAYRRGRNLTDEERLERMKDITAKRKQLKDNLLNAITTTSNVTANILTKNWQDAKQFRPWYEVGSNIGALGLRAIESAIPTTIQELQAELVELKASRNAYPALKLAKEIPIVKKGLSKLDEATINLRNNLLASIRGDQILPDGTIVKKGNQPLQMTGGGSGSTFRHSILNKTNRGLYKQLKNQDPKLIEQAENIIKELDLFKTTEGSSQQFTKWNPNRPTTGFRGTRTVPYINSSGVPSEVAFRWSVSKNTYVPYDLVRRQNTILKRLRWNVNRSPKAKWYSDKVYKIAREDNAVLKQLLEELREENPQRYFDIMGDTRNYATNKGFIFVEHIHAQNSPYWKYVSKGQFKPRDTSNLMIVKNENFGKLKTSIEKHIYDNKDFVFPDGKRLILDYDKTRDVLVLKQLQDNGRLKRMGDISPITNPRNWKRALDAALEGHTIQTGKAGEIQQVIQGDPDIDRNVDLQHGISDWNKPKE